MRIMKSSRKGFLESLKPPATQQILRVVEKPVVADKRGTKGEDLS